MSRTIKHPYTKSKNFDKTCRSHGGCSYCYSNRLIHTLKELHRTSFKLALEESIDSSSDLRNFIYPEKDEYFDKHYYPDDTLYLDYEQKTIQSMSNTS